MPRAASNFFCPDAVDQLSTLDSILASPTLLLVRLVSASSALHLFHLSRSNVILPPYSSIWADSGE